MKPRLSFDDVAWEKSDDIEESWLDFLLDEDVYNEIGLFLAEHGSPRQWADFKLFKTGGFNASFLMTFINSDNDGFILRFPMPGVHMFPEEKVRNEASVMEFITNNASNNALFPVPLVSCWGERRQSPSNIGPFIIRSYIDHERSMSDVLEKPGRQTRQRPELNPEIGTTRLRALYRELAIIVFSLSTLSANRIGTLKKTETSAWEVAYRPLSMSMNEIVRLGTLPRSKLPTTIYDNASSYFGALAELHIAHLKNQRNDAIDSADDCRRKFVARFLFRKLVRDQELRDKWVSHENGPFPLWCDDLRPQNIMVDNSEKAVGVIDWEFTYTAPVEFSYAPPWWLLLEKPEYWSQGLDDWCSEYEKKLEIFLQAMVDCEEEVSKSQDRRVGESQRLSSQMRHSWTSGDFWIMYAARNNFAFDAIYGSTSDSSDQMKPTIASMIYGRKGFIS